MAREPHFVVKYSSYLGTAIKLVLYILKQLFLDTLESSSGVPTVCVLMLELGQPDSPPVDLHLDHPLFLVFVHRFQFLDLAFQHRASGLKHRDGLAKKMKEISDAMRGHKKCFLSEIPQQRCLCPPLNNCACVKQDSSTGPRCSKQFEQPGPEYESWASNSCLDMTSSSRGLTWTKAIPCSPKGPFTHATSNAISRTKRALPYPPQMLFREASRASERKL